MQRLELGRLRAKPGGQCGDWLYTIFIIIIIIIIIIFHNFQHLVASITRRRATLNACHSKLLDAAASRTHLLTTCTRSGDMTTRAIVCFTPSNESTSLATVAPDSEYLRIVRQQMSPRLAESGRTTFDTLRAFVILYMMRGPGEGAPGHIC